MKGKNTVDIIFVYIEFEVVKTEFIIVLLLKLSPYLEFPVSMKTAIILLFIAYRNLYVSCIYVASRKYITSIAVIPPLSFVIKKHGRVTKVTRKEYF